MMESARVQGAEQLDWTIYRITYLITGCWPRLIASMYACQGGDLLDWTSDSGIQEAAFIQRIEALSTMGYSVLLSNYRRYFKLAAYLSTFTKESIVIALGLPSLVVWPQRIASFAK